MDTCLEWKIVVGQTIFINGDKKKTATIKEEPSDGLNKKQKHG